MIPKDKVKEAKQFSMTSILLGSLCLVVGIFTHPIVLVGGVILLIIGFHLNKLIRKYNNQVDRINPFSCNPMRVRWDEETFTELVVKGGCMVNGVYFTYNELKSDGSIDIITEGGEAQHGNVKMILADIGYDRIAMIFAKAGKPW